MFRLACASVFKQLFPIKPKPFAAAFLPFDLDGFEWVLYFLKFGHFSNAFEGMVSTPSLFYLGNGFKTYAFNLMF